MLAYPVALQRDTNDSLLVTFPDIPEAVTSAHEQAQVLQTASDALESALAFYFEDGRAIPMPSNPQPGQPMVALEPALADKVDRHNSAKSQIDA